MKETQVDQDGRIRCPVCGGSDFSDKRTGKAKVGGVLTLGVGVVAMPKRLKCRGCGQNLKRGGGPYKPKKGMPGYVEAQRDPRANPRVEAERIKAEADAKVASGEPLNFGERTLAVRMAERRARKAPRQDREVDERLARQQLMAEREAQRKDNGG